MRSGRSHDFLIRGSPGASFRRGAAGKSVRFLCLLCAAAVSLFAAQPQRIVSTSPGITEILYALGLGDRVAGVTTYCHYPPEAATKPKVGDFLRPNLEVILALKPDLVISESTGVRASVRLNVPALEIRNGSVAEIYAAIRVIGKAAGVPERAEALVARMRSGLESIRASTANLPRRRAVFIAGRTPGRVEDLIVAGRTSHLDELIGLAGGENVFRDTVSTYSKVSLESFIARDPEVVIDMGEMADTEGVTDAQKRAVVDMWAARLPQLAAVRRKAVYGVASDIYVVPGPRIVDAAREFARMLHPEAGL